MYLLMKHRMQVQTRYLSRRPDLFNACNFPSGNHHPNGGSGRHVELMPTMDDHHAITFPFRALAMGQQQLPVLNNEGPPPYIAPGYRARRGREILPPLPSYDDATKLPAFR